MDPDGKAPYRLATSREVYRNPWIRVREDRVIRPDGSSGLFGVMEGKTGASVLALNDLHEVYLIREYKHAVARHSLEVMSGGLEPGESPLDAARRELKEEAGLTASEWTELGMIDPFTTFVNAPNYLFLARGIQEGEQSPDHGEVLEVVKTPFSRAVEMVMRGEITHGASCVAILKAARYF
ncbi:MAG: NUDIX hydrolase [Acidobacteria bacterium]|nr:NUDIX hydrolase [Acidobacteriota bacterium]MBI3471075.1 NUDIX hydrolase [Candidatus Solibacter usitatus]